MTGKDTADLRPGSPRGERQEETQELGLKTQLLSTLVRGQPHRSGERGAGVPEGTPREKPGCLAPAEICPRPGIQDSDWARER